MLRIFEKYKLYFGPLWYQQDCNVIVEITDIKRGLLPKHVSQRTQQHGDYTNFVGNDKNNVFQLASCINYIHTWERHFLHLLLLKVCEMPLFRHSKNVYSILWSIQAFAFLEKKRPSRYCLWGENLAFNV